MDYKKVIVESWKSTQRNKSLIVWFGFLPALFTTTVGVGYMAYQFFAFKTLYYDEADESFFEDVVTFIWEFIKANVSLTVPLIVFAVIFGLLYILLPTLTRAGAIQAIAREKNGQKTGVGVGVRYGILSFLKLFEYHLLIKTFAFFSVLMEMSFVLRNLGIAIFQFLIPVFILFTIISFLLTILFTYTDFFIVIDDEGVFSSMKKSAKLVLMNWKHTFLITVLMVIIGIRIIFQAVFVLLIPALIVFITGYVATVALPATSVIIGGVLGLIALILSAYLNGIVDIFSYTVWTHTFLELSSEKEVHARETFIDDIGEKPHDYHGHKNL